MHDRLDSGEEGHFGLFYLAEKYPFYEELRLWIFHYKSLGSLAFLNYIYYHPCCGDLSYDDKFAKFSTGML